MSNYGWPGVHGYNMYSVQRSTPIYDDRDAIVGSLTDCVKIGTYEECVNYMMSEACEDSDASYWIRSPFNHGNIPHTCKLPIGFRVDGDDELPF